VADMIKSRKFFGYREPFSPDPSVSPVPMG
jgi:hypothetical protein